MSLPNPLAARHIPGRRRHLEIVPDTKPQQQTAEVFSFPDTAQFRRYSGKISVAGATAHYAHFRARNPIEETPIQVVNGYLGTQPAYEALARSLATHGRHTTIIKPTRHQNLLASIHPDHLKDVLRLPAQVNHKVADAIADQWSYDEVDLLMHSMGTPVGSEYAAKKPHEVRSAMATGPAGMDGPAGLFAMLGRLKEVGKDEIWAGRDLLLQNAPLSIIPETAHYMFRHPLRTVREGVAAATRDARPDMLRAKAGGVLLGAMIMEDDLFFNPLDILENSEDIFDWIHILEGANHIHPQTHPEEHAIEQIQGFHQLNHGEVISLTASL